MYLLEDKLVVTGVLSGFSDGSNINSTLIYAYVYAYLNWIDNNIDYNLCFSNGKLFRFDFKKLIYYILTLIDTCSIVYPIFYFSSKIILKAPQKK